ncbi:transposase [Jidongwangia harbinensis]|uniref:transposase n=1 Tax=Jidongwangia harbinensis TaxID=2878561 RepID=UPI001CDA43DC|nr:transposase [Jidongwangia harbinensis]MCA2213887.1 transposase [Jidongwangia harbinensis]
MALVRVYCGLASADESVRTASVVAPLSIAVVDDAGRLLGVHEISDDPAGYAQLGALLVERTSGFSDAAVAADSDDHVVTSLLTAAGRPLAVADDDATDDFAERFADDDSPDEMQAPHAARRAVGLARALQAGALDAVTTPAPRELTSYKPILAAHVAMLTGRHAAAIALREVLRELYPAALRAYPDPAHPLAMAVLDALPEPGRLTGRGTDQNQIAEDVVAELTRAGVGTEDQVASAVTAIVLAINESPRRGGINKSLAGSAADTVRQAVGAVRSCDNACETLIGTLAARAALQTPSAPAPRRSAGARRAADTATNLQAVRPGDTGTRLTRPGDTGTRITRPGDTGTRITRPGDTRTGRRSRPEPAAGNSPATPRPLTTPPVAPEPIMPPPLAPRPVTPPPVAPAAAAGLPSRTPNPPPGNRPVSVPPPPPGMTPIVPGSRSPVPPDQPAPPTQPFRSTITDAAMGKARAERQRTVIPPRPNTRTPATNGASDYSLSMPAQRPGEDKPEPGSRANWPLLNNDDDLAPATVSGPPSDGRVKPPWQDMPKEPPALRLVEPQLGGLADIPADVTAITEPPPLRLVDRDTPERNGRNGRATPRRTTLTALDRSTQPPVPAEGDGDLLIFAAARSAWFTGHSEAPTTMDWTSPLDTGWQAAEKAATPEVAAETAAGLPKRVPQANLVPGSPLRDERPLRIVRDAASIAAHTTGYFRGWRRGQEIGGYAIGGRPGREAAGGWDFSRDGQPEDYRNNADYRSS